MAVEVILPKVDMDMTHGTLAVWHASEGDAVRKGDPLFDIETDKAAMEVEAPATGRLRRVAAAPGERIAVGAVIAWIDPEGIEAASPPEPPPDAPARDTVPVAEPIADVLWPVAMLPVGETGTSLRATPAARAAARAAGMALDGIPGTGPRGRIQRADVTPPPPDLAPAMPAGGWTPQPGPLAATRRAGTSLPIVLIHGLAADSQSWAPLEKALGPARALIRIDLPGHGRSPRRRIGGFADLARMMVEAFDDALGEAEQVHLLGHSLGGALALAIADIRARRVASLCLIAPAGLGPEIDAGALGGIVRASRTESLAPWLRRLTAGPEGISDDYARSAMRARSDPMLRACQSDMAEALFPDGVQAFDLCPALGRLQIPAQVLWGRQDHILPHRQVLATGGDFGIHLLKGAGHLPHVECPDRVARLLTRLIAGAAA